MVGRRVLVCGGRDFADRDVLFAALDREHAASPVALIIHGAAAGADRLADDWAARRRVSCARYPADWARLGRSAGPLRNRLMLVGGRPDLVLAFPGGKGTEDMKRQARAAGVEVVEVPDGEARYGG